MLGVSGMQATAARTPQDVLDPFDEASSSARSFRKANFRSHISSDSFDQMCQHGRCVRYGQGETVFHEGDPAFGLYVIDSGKVKLSKRTYNGKKMIMRLLGPKDLMGTEAVFDHSAYDTDAETLENAALHFLDRPTLWALLQQTPELRAQLLGHLSSELIQLRTWLLETAYAGSLKRLTHVLLMLAEKFGSPVNVDGQMGVDLGLCLMRGELAELAGLTTETTIRILRKFQQRSWLVLQKHRVVLLQLEALLSVLDVDNEMALSGRGARTTIDNSL